MAERIKEILLKRQEEEDAEMRELRREGQRLEGITVMAPHVDRSRPKSAMPKRPSSG